MKPMTYVAAVVAALCLPSLAPAQQRLPRTDVEYCSELGDLYNRYVGGSEFGGRYASNRSDPEARVAIAQCPTANTAGSIAVLERKLTASKVNLPART